MKHISDGNTEAAASADLNASRTDEHGRRVQIVVLAADHSTTHAVAAGRDLILGSAATADLRIDDPSVAPAHARLHVGEPSTIVDLGSAGGTFVRDRQLEAGAPAPVALYERVTLGAVSIVLQPRPPAAAVRRIRLHDYFEGRLAEECARARRHGGTFALLRVHGHAAESDRAVGETIARMIRATDTVASYAPGDFEILLADATPDGASGVADAVIARCADQGVRTRASVTCFPRDGAEADRLLAAMRAGDAAPSGEHPVVVRDPAMMLVYELAARVAKGSISVLLLGETGVGKEVIAEAIHELSPRARQPLVRLSCVALSETLLESELFGHEKGAFTGAHQAKPGLIESAHGGTLFLDEVGEMPASTQAKLLRVIETRQLTRVGSVQSRPIDVRFIAATHRDLEVEVARGAFRQDLYYRLDGVTVVIPPLRERRSEIRPLAEAFLARACAEAGRSLVGVSPAVWDLLLGYPWPGNVRELRNVIARALLLCPGDTIEPAHLPLEKLSATSTVAAGPDDAAPDPAPPLARWSRNREAAELEAERDRIIELLVQHGGNQGEAARALGISRRTLINRMEQHGLPRPRKRTPTKP